MKIAVIVKTDFSNSKVYTTHRSKVTYHTDDLFLSQTDKNAIEYALQWIKVNDGTIDAYTFEDGVLADRVLHEALAMGVNKATKITGVDIHDPLQSNEIATKFAKYLKENCDYDLILTGDNPETDVISAALAQKMNINYYDHVSQIDTSFKFETELGKGKIRGQFKLPAVISVLDSINTPHLPSFINLRDALETKLNIVKWDLKHVKDSSDIVADQRKQKKVIFDLSQDPEAVKELVDELKKDGILK